MGLSTQGVILGIDVGYGNCKVVAGDVARGVVREVVLPSGAAPVGDMPRLHDRPDLKGGELVLLDGAEWVAGVEQLHIQNAVRKTHSAYTREKEYEALFKAALARSGYDHVSCVVTGLPVQLFYGPESKQLQADLVRLMQGRKHISATRSVTVDQVIVVPQPFGTFMSLASQPEFAFLHQDEDLFGIVADPGFGTVDVVAFLGQAVAHQFSDSSALATSHILERVAENMSKQMGLRVTSDRLDMAMRRGQTLLTMGNETFDIRPLLEQVGREVGEKIAALIHRILRSSERPVDYVIITGGGASLYAPALMAAFPKSRILTPQDPVLANARGYFTFGKIKHQQVRGHASAA